jgi:hypothetical protein
MNITKEYLEKGYIVHNQNQISVEIDYQIFLLTFDNVEDFIKENNL